MENSTKFQKNKIKKIKPSYNIAIPLRENFGKNQDLFIEGISVLTCELRLRSHSQPSCPRTGGQIRKTLSVNTVDYDSVESRVIVSFVDTAGKWRRLWEGVDTDSMLTLTEE